MLSSDPADDLEARLKEIRRELWHHRKMPFPEVRLRAWMDRSAGLPVPTDARRSRAMSRGPARPAGRAAWIELPAASHPLHALGLQGVPVEARRIPPNSGVDHAHARYRDALGRHNAWAISAICARHGAKIVETTTATRAPKATPSGIAPRFIKRQRPDQSLSSTEDDPTSRSGETYIGGLSCHVWIRFFQTSPKHLWRWRRRRRGVNLRCWKP